MTLSEMRKLIDQRGLRLTKSLGQNFLHDSHQLHRIVALGDIQPTDRILEIGPGLGPLTELLKSTGAEVLAIEKDTRLVSILVERFPHESRLEIRSGDALEILKNEPRDWSQWKLIANLPYSVASPLLVTLAQSDGCPERLVATLQWEVAQRIEAKRDTSEYGILTLLLGLHYEVGESFKIPPGCFFPSPDVDSACVCLVRRPKRLLNPVQSTRFNEIVKKGFSQRRKMMLKLLKQQWPLQQLTESFDQAGIALTERAEKVSLDQFCMLARSLAGI